MASPNFDFKVFKGSKEGSVIQSQTHRGALEGDQVLIKITHSGLCGTDEHYRTADQVLGHEGAGIVQELGPGVRYLKKGDNVGFGYLHASCGHCFQCLTGKENYCKERVMYGYGDLDLGSMATHTIWQEAYVYKIPSSIPNEYAAPLQCGGATVYNALMGYETRPTERVGIIGVGGLGHLAIQYAAKMGCEVVVFSGTDSKKDEAKALGANEFYATKGAKELKTKPIDRLLVTTSSLPDWNLYIPVLAPEAKIFPLTIAHGDFVFPYMPLLVQGFTVQGTITPPRAVHNQMLAFSAQHNIKPIIEKFPMTEEGIKQAFDHLKGGGMRYRGVLVAPE